MFRKPQPLIRTLDTGQAAGVLATEFADVPPAAGPTPKDLHAGCMNPTTETGAPEGCSVWAVCFAAA